MRFLYPQSVLSPKKPDELFKEEVEAVAQRGIPVSLFDSEVLENKLVAFKPKVEIEETTIYRGWMLTAAEYENLAQSVSGVGGKPLISAVQYLAAHHLPNWYKLLSDLTAPPAAEQSAPANPMRPCVPSQNGFFADWPQRHRLMRSRPPRPNARPS